MLELKDPPVAALGTIEQLPDPRCSEAEAHEALNVTDPMVSLFCKPEEINSEPEKVFDEPYVFEESFAVILSARRVMSAVVVG